MPSLAGSLLVASPMLHDDNFARAVVLVLEHTDDGALGLVLNRPSGTGVGEALPHWEAMAQAPPALFIGGPVEPGAAICLATVVPGADPPGWRRLSGDLGVLDLGSDPAWFAGILSGLRVFVGYAGWAAGQLDGELSVGGWYRVPAEPGDALCTRPDDLWRDVLRRQPGPLALLSTFPLDPRLN